MNDLTVYGAADVARLLDMPGCIEAVRQAMAEHADAEVARLLDLRVKALVELFAGRAA